MNETILIVEDHAAIRESLHAWLRDSFPGCRVHAVGSSAEAEALAGADAPEVVVLDIGLPSTDGFEATRRIKLDAPGAHIVLLGVYDTDAHRAGADAAGANAYVTKRNIGSDLIPILTELLCGNDAVSARAPAGGIPNCEGDAR